MLLYWGGVLAVVVLTVAAPAALAHRLPRRLGAPFRVAEVGAGFYLVSLVVQLPVLAVLRGLGGEGGLVFATVAVPAVHASFEEGLRYLSFRAGRTMRSCRTAGGALVAGLGYGCMEALIFDLSLAWTVALATFAPDVLRAGNLELDRDPTSAAGFFAVFALSRLAAIAVHVGLATLVVLAYRRSWTLLAAAVAAHFAVSASTLAVQALNAGPAWVGLYVVWAAGALALLARARRSPLLSGPQVPARETQATLA